MKNSEYIWVRVPKNFPGKKYHGLYTLEHRLVYWQHTGIIPRKDELIHHINGNKHDNCFKNLQLVSIKKHSADIHDKKTLPYRLICPNCGKTFFRKGNHVREGLKKNKNGICCSRSCSSRNYQKSIKNKSLTKFH